MDKFSEEEKQSIRDEYIKFKNIEETACQKMTSQGNLYIGNSSNGGTVMELLFGEENLQPKIKTWEDIEKRIIDDHIYPIRDGSYYEKTIIKEFSKYLDNTLIKKLLATYKIAKLIELDYGGMVTNEEWQEGILEKFMIYSAARANGSTKICTGSSYYQKFFIAFHTNKQREEFISYPENVELIKNYYMI